MASQTNRQTNRDLDRQTEIQIAREPVRLTDKPMGRETGK